MLKKIIMAVIPILILLLPGCTPKNGSSVLDYQNDISSVKASFSSAGENFEIVFSKEAKDLELTAPSTLSGTVFTKGERGFTVSNGDVSLEIEKSVSAGLEPIFSAFSLTEESVSDISKDDSGRTVLTISQYGGTYYVILTDGTPTELSYSGERSFTMSHIEIEYLQNTE